jgi:diguanylate cyclase (GGDEF)-like protein
MPGEYALDSETETLLKLFNQLDFTVFAVCDDKLRLVQGNSYFKKTLHRDDVSSGSNLADYLEIEPAQVEQILQNRESYALSLQIKPDNRSFKAAFVHLRNYILFIGELVDIGEMDILSSITTLSNEANNAARELRRKNRELENANTKIEELMRTDPLTGLFNRRFLTEHLSRVMSLARRNGWPLSLIICDIDHFKSINDTYGHDTGDTVLREFSRLISETSRKEDIIVRFGGEEFIVVLEHTDIQSALAAGEKLRKVIENTAMMENRTVTASFGITAFNNEDSEESLIKRADQGLYKSKEAGRNRCTVIE